MDHLSFAWNAILHKIWHSSYAEGLLAPWYEKKQFAWYIGNLEALGRWPGPSMPMVLRGSSCPTDFNCHGDAKLGPISQRERDWEYMWIAHIWCLAISPGRMALLFNHGKIQVSCLSSLSLIISIKWELDVFMRQLVRWLEVFCAYKNWMLSRILHLALFLWSRALTLHRLVLFTFPF